MQTMMPNPPARWSMPPHRMNFNAPPNFQNTRPPFIPHQFQPRMSIPRTQNNHQGNVPVGNELDAKRPVKKSTARKTVDYNAGILHYIEARVWQRARSDRRAVQPDSIYYSKMLPPQSMLENPTNAVTTKFVRTSTNKMRCPIFCCIWTPEGRRLVTGASSGEFTLWNGLTFNFETILQAHDCSVRSMVWSHNDQWMVTGDHSGFVKYWQSNMNNVKMFQAHKEAIRGISFCPTDTKMVTCSDDGTVRLIDFFTCYEENILRGHGADVKCVDWHPQKGLIVSGSKDSQQPIKLWDPRTAESLATIHFHKSTVMCTKWNQNGNWLLTGSRDHLLKIFDIRNLSQEVQTFRGHKKEVCSVAWHPQHETLFASGGSDGSIMFWNVGTDKEVGCMEHAHDGIVWTLSWHPLGHILCSGSNDHTSKFWTRNRPGDKMRDNYNLNTLPKGADEAADCEEDVATSVANLAFVAPTVIPGMGLEQDLLEKLKPDKSLEEPSIPGLDFNTDDSLPAKKVPFAKPIPKSFQQLWMENKRPVSLLPAPSAGVEKEPTPGQESQVPPNMPEPQNSQQQLLPNPTPSPMNTIPQAQISQMPPNIQGSMPPNHQGTMPPGGQRPPWRPPNGMRMNQPFQQQGPPGNNSMFRQMPPPNRFPPSGAVRPPIQHQGKAGNMPDWQGNRDKDDRLQPNNVQGSDFNSRSANSMNPNWNNKFSDRDDRPNPGQPGRNFGDSDLRTANSNVSKNHDADERLDYPQQMGMQGQNNFNPSSDHQRGWNSSNNNNSQYSNEGPNSMGRKRQWNNGPGSNNQNNNFSNNPDSRNSIPRGRGFGRGGRGGVRGRGFRGFPR